MNRFDDELRRVTGPLAREPLPQDILDEALEGPPNRWRWAPAAAVTVGAAVLVVAAGIGIGGEALPTPSPPVAPSPDATPSGRPGPSVAHQSPQPAEPIIASVEEIGIRLTIALDRDRSVFGQRVLATATIENIGADSVFWGHSGSCVYPASLRVYPDDPVRLRDGREDWPGDDGVLKRVTVIEGLGDLDPMFAFLPEEWLDFEGNVGCTSDLVISELAAGDSLIQHLGWDTVAYYDMPPVPGSYTIDAAFAFMSRGAYPTGDASPDEFSVELTLPFEVGGSDVDYISPGEAIDALLSDAAFRAHLAQAPRSRWLQSNIKFVNGRWETALYLTRSGADVEPVGAIVATVDARSGVVLDVALDEGARPPGG